MSVLLLKSLRAGLRLLHPVPLLVQHYCPSFGFHQLSLPQGALSLPHRCAVPTPPCLLLAPSFHASHRNLDVPGQGDCQGVSGDRRHGPLRGGDLAVRVKTVGLRDKRFSQVMPWVLS